VSNTKASAGESERIWMGKLSWKPANLPPHPPFSFLLISLFDVDKKIYEIILNQFSYLKCEKRLTYGNTWKRSEGKRGSKCGEAEMRIIRGNRLGGKTKD
jgi:hypothetical protein